MRMEELLEKEAEGDQLLQALIEDYMDNTPSGKEASIHMQFNHIKIYVLFIKKLLC